MPQKIDANNPRNSFQQPQRRKPKQQRAIATVDAILQATKELVEKEGFYNLTTNRIAEYSGVGIGSLYHYFPNRESIINSLYEETVVKVAKEMKEVIFKHVSEDVEQALPAMIDAVTSLFEANETVLINLYEEVPSLRKSSHSLSLEVLIHSVSRVYMTQHDVGTDHDEIEAYVYFTSTTFFEHVRKYILEKPTHITREEFIKHLSKMINFYLQTPA